MSFRPNMTAFTDGIRALGALRWRAWEGVVADLWHAEGTLGGGGHYVSPDPRIVIFLKDGGKSIRLSDTPNDVASRPAGQISYIPAGMPLWSQIIETGEFRHLDLHFDGVALTQKLGERYGMAWAVAALAKPIMLGQSPEIDRIAHLLADEMQGDGQHDLFGEGLVQAILGRVLSATDCTANAEPLRGGLTPHQMRRVTDFMQASLHRRVPVSELAAQIGLSESWFARAFKQTNGETPHAWQQQLRISAAKAMLGRDGSALVEIAAATGFADQAHMTRAFRLVTGTTPAAWRRGHYC
ncbi:AraC family transcriptional regulator [Cypionkella sp.]|uniref:helix-turn-helix domain-containing protein n=1 Tax=Cypionkella sp. TaxID=2811411 RepID=UPI002627AE9F|nr:AraC family transcriptional regulator [Cypionkella sp.]MDB5665135.1 AraC family transcriptional regulator [Cypionkella sp.]